MSKRIMLMALLAGAALALGLGAGCGPSTELTGTPIPNALPSTKVTATPPSLIETGFLVRFYWSGFDPDGRVVKYQWRISDNGTNGISVQDTLTFDPVTGDTLNPWFETVATDSVFLVSAEIPDFPGDLPGVNRSYQTHTFWVRAVDDKGAVDPNPAHVSFTATTLLPTVDILGPQVVRAQTSFARLPRVATFTFRGTDPDFVSGMPTKVRYLWKPALRAGTYITDQTGYDQFAEQLISFEDSLWSPWLRYDPEDETRRITLPDLTPSNEVYYFFAMQVQDTAGAVSIDRNYGVQVANVRISATLSPALWVGERYLGRFGPATGVNNERSFDVAAGQQLEFRWGATAQDYAGLITSYRYGWNVGDFDDPADPGWALQPGTSPQHLRTPPGTSFASGVHQLVVQVRDNSNQVARWLINLNVVPVPDPTDQAPLLLVDDVDDRGSNAWQGLDVDGRRDAFWAEVIGNPGGVAGWNPFQHVIDTRADKLTYRDAVAFRSLVWKIRYSGAFSLVGEEFRPAFVDNFGDADKYVWLIPYQQGVGNVLYAGAAALTSHLSVGSAVFEMPVVFQSREGDRAGTTMVGTARVRRGFGYTEEGDQRIWSGPTRYPFEVMGISVLDIMSVGRYYEYGIGQAGSLDARRRRRCVGLKGLQVDPTFKANYFAAGNLFAETIWTDPNFNLGSHDHNPATNPYIIDANYTWGEDEFYNADVVGRGTPFDIQSGPAWGCDGPCVETIFRSISRFDWARMKRLEADATDTWPIGYFGGAGQPTLTNVCGTRALAVNNLTALTNDRIVGFIARKTAANKPSRAGDVVLGFDPYRFDHAQMTRVIRWVLGEHFGLDMTTP